MKLKLKDKKITHIALNGVIYTVDRNGYVNIPNGVKYDASLFDVAKKRTAKPKD